MATAISKETGIDRMSMKVESMTSKGRLRNGSLTLGMVLESPGTPTSANADVDKLVEDQLDLFIQSLFLPTSEKACNSITCFAPVLPRISSGLPHVIIGDNA